MKFERRRVICQIVSVMALSLNWTAAHGNTLNLRANPPTLSQQSGIKVPDATGGMCAKDPTPRVLGVNGIASGNVFRPGSKLRMNGCSLGNGGLAWLVEGTVKRVPLIVDSWNDNYIQAHIDNQISGVPDLNNAQLALQPNGKPYIRSNATTFGTFVATRTNYVVTTNVPKYVGLHFLQTSTSTSGGWGKPWGTFPVTIEPDGTVRRLTAGISGGTMAGADDELMALDPGNGFKVVRFKMQCLNDHYDNGVRDFNTNHVIWSSGCSLSNATGKWVVSSGEVFIQNHNDQPTVACTTEKGPVDRCHYSIYRISAVLQGPIGMIP